MIRKRKDAIRIIILLLSLETRISSQQPFPDTEDFIPNVNHDVTAFQNKTSAKTQQSNDGYYLDLLSGICREGWIKGRINDVTVCLRTNTHPLSWSDARDTCRKDFSFLIKMEAPVSIESRKLEDYLKIKNIDNIWTGIHEEGGYLVWDEISPHKVRAYNDPLEDELLQRRNWKWNIEPDDDDEDSVDNDDFEFHEESRTTCGLLNFNQYIEKHTLSKRSVEKMLKQIKQNDDIPELEQTPAPGSREVDTPQDISHLTSVSKLRALELYIKQLSRHSSRRRTTFNANKVKKFIESQRKLLEKQENDREFTTNLNEAIEPVQPTEETDFPDERKDHPKNPYLQQTLDKSKTLPGLTADLEDSNSTFEGVVTPRSILTTAASLVSIPTRPTRPVIIPLPTDPVYENFTMNDQKANFTEHKLAGVPIPAFKPEDATNTRKENQQDEKVKNEHPADFVDYEDLLFRESKKNTTQSNVKKPTPKTKIQRTATIPTKPIVPPKSSVHKKPTKQTASKKNAQTMKSKKTANIESVSSSEEMTDISPIGIANISEKVSTLETDKEEKMRQILDSLVSSSESGDSTEDTDEIDDSTDPLEINNILKQQKQIGNETERELPQKEPPSIAIPPAIIINSRKSNPSKSSSSPSDERKHRASETDEIILTEEIKSNSNEKSASKTKLEKSSEQSKVSKAVKIPLEKIETPKPVLVNIGQADSEELKAYLDAMKPTTKEDGLSDEGTGKETKRKSESGSNPTTLFNTKAFYDLPETFQEKSGKKTSEESNEDEKEKEKQIKTKTDARGGVPLSLAMLHSDNTSGDDNTDDEGQRQDIANKSPSTHKQKNTKLKEKVSAIPIPVSIIEKNEDKFTKENMKREQFQNSNNSSEKSSEKTSNLAENIEVEDISVDSTYMSRSNQRGVEKEENFSDSLSSDTLSFEDEEKDRDKKRKFSKNMKKITDNFPPPINITKPQLQTQVKEQPKQEYDKSSLTEKSDELVEDSLESNVILNKTKPTAKAFLNDKTENVIKISNEKESSEEIQNNSETGDSQRTTTSATKISANAPPTPLKKIKTSGSSNQDSDKSEEKAEIPKPISTTQSSSLGKIDSSTTEKSKTGVNQRQTAGGIIIPTQSNDIFSSLSEKSIREGKHMISNSRESRMKSNVFNKEKLEKVNPLETTRASIEVDDTSQIISSSEELSASTDSSTVTSATLRDNGDDSDSSKDIMESEPDDAILVIDRSDKNKTDSYSSDEESDETKEMKTVTIIPGVEDYVSTSTSEEDVSKELKATLPMPITNIQVKNFEISEEKDETKKVDTLEEGNSRKGSGLDKLTEINTSNEEKIKKILNKVDERVNHERVIITENLEKEMSEESNRELVSANHEENDRKTLDIEKSVDIKHDFERQENAMNKTKSSLQSSIASDESSNVEHNGIVAVNKINQVSSNRNDNDENSAKESVSNEDEKDDGNKNSNEEITSLATSDISTDSNHKPKVKSKSNEGAMSKENESTPSSLSHLTSHTQFNNVNGSADINSREQTSTSVQTQAPNSTQSPIVQGKIKETDEKSSEENISSNDSQTSTSTPVRSLHKDITSVIKKNKTDDDDFSSEESVLLSTTVNSLSKDLNLKSIEDEKDESKKDMKETVSSEDRDVKTSLSTKFTPIYTAQESSEYSKDSAEIADKSIADKQSGSSNTTINQLHNSETDASSNEITEKNSDLESKEDIGHPTDSLPINDVVDAISGENIQLDARKQASDEKSLVPPSHASQEEDSGEENEKVVSKENMGNNSSNESDENIIPMMDHSNEEDKSNLLADNVEFKNTVKEESNENMEDSNASVIRTDDKTSLSSSGENSTTKPYLNDNSSSSESAENIFESSEEDNDRVVRFRNSEENKLMRSGNYEFKDFYDHNNEIQDDDDMYRKEVNRDKMERDKHFELKSSSEMPIVLEAIRNIDDSREETQTIKSDEAFRSLFEKLNNRSKSLMAEAASKDEFRHREDQDLDFAGIRAGEMSDDIDMDPEDILAQEADLKAEARVNQALLPNFQKSHTIPKISLSDGKAHMKLSNCNTRRTSMCYTYPVTVESQASTCDSGWVGHVFHTKCYRIMRNANTIPKMPYKNAMSICKMEGGSIAELNDGYKGNYLLMTLLKSIREHMRELPPKEEIPPIWVRRGSQDSSCSVMTLSGPIAVGCNQSIAVAVCEKNANDIRIQNTRTMDTSLAIKEFAINDKKILQCDLKNSASELPILWFKDGRLIDIKVRKRKSSIFPHLGGRPISPLPEPAETDVTSLELNTWLRKTLVTSTDQSLTDEIFQGHYWCAAWKTNPFVREKSKEIFVRFTDVITFVGIILLPAIPYDERLLHNKIEKNLPPILNIMTDLRYINNIVFRKLQQEFPNLESTSAYPRDISSKPPLLLSFNVYIRASKNYSTADEMPLYKSMRTRYQEILRDGNILTRLPRGTPLRFVRSLKIRSTVSCQQTTLTDPRTRLAANFFPAGINLNVSSIDVCENGEKAGRATCKGTFKSGAYWGNIQITRRCGTPDTRMEENDEDSSDQLLDDDEQGEEYENLVQRMTAEERLRELAEMEIEENNLESVIEETAEIADTVEDFKEIDLEYINEIMEKSAISNGKSRFVTAKALETVDRLLTVDDMVFQKSKRVSSIIKNFEKIVEDTDLSDDGHFRLVLPNVAMEIYELERFSQPVIGMAAKTDENGKAVYTPFNQQRIVSIYNESVFYDDIDVAIHLPPELVEETKAENKSRLYMMVYRDGNLFQDSSMPNNAQRTASESKRSNNKKLNSFVISASIGGRKIEGLKQKVKTIFRPLKDVGGRTRTCAFYNFTLNNMAGGWSSAGCTYDGQVNGRDVCLCDHLTNFAVLVDYYGQDDRVDHVHEVSLSIISLIGLSLSILGLSLTIISFVFFRKLRKGRAQQTLFNLALAMLCSWVIFLVGIKQTYHFIGCLIVAILLHYFILASFMWMLMEAFLQYLTFVKVLGTYVTRYTLKSVIAAWGLPVIPIICVLSVDHNLYKGGDHYCWMSLDAFYYAFAIPVGVIILANLVIFIITVVSIFRRPQGLRSNQSKHKMAITNLQAAITSFVLLGLSWILGYFAISDARLPFQYAFTILSSLQGFFIFVLFVARKKQVREQWKMICCCIYPDQQKAQRTLSASASYPSTCSSRSTSSTSTLHHQGRTDRSDSCKTTTSFIGTDYDSIYTVPYSRASRDSLYYRKL